MSVHRSQLLVAGGSLHNLASGCVLDAGHRVAGKRLRSRGADELTRGRVGAEERLNGVGKV